jgi:predicted phage replisome organizer
MSEIKWIKITTSMFEDEKIRYLESLPDADSLIVIWIKLLTLCGKSNACGYILLTENIPYTEEMLANQFHRPLNTIKLAIQMFLKLGMVESNEKGYFVSNWIKHQNADGLDKIKERDRLRKAQQREREKLFMLPVVTGMSQDGHTLSHSTSQECHTTDIEVEVEEEVDKDKDIKNKSSKSSSIQDKNEKITFEEYRLYINKLYPDVDCDNEFIKFNEWWSEGKKELKRPKVAWHNWLDNSRKFKNNNKVEIKNDGNNHKDPYWD